MSSILFYVFLSLTLFYLVFFILNSIFSFKNNAKLKKIFEILQSSFLLLSFTAIMIFFLPNSRNLMRITLSFLILSLTGFSFSQDGTKNSFKYTGNILILLSLAALFKLFLPSIRLTKISGIAFLLTITLYVLLSVLSLFIIFNVTSVKKESVTPLLFFDSAKLLFSFVLNFSALLTLIFDKTLYSIIFFAGTFILLISFLFEVAERLKDFSARFSFFRTFLFTLALPILLSASVFMLI